MRRTFTAAAIAVAAVLVTTTPDAQFRVAPVAERPDSVTLELLLRKLASTGTFMQTDAHPDDEDNGLLAMLGYGRGMRATLVTATRGDGGQNEIGPEIGQALGVLRTEELHAVHRFDGAEQYFTRAIDFGFSFSVEESIEKWGRGEIVGDLVRHIRTIRPDVIAGFLCGGQAGGLHHQASTQLTLEAFRAAADPAKYPEQIKEGLRPWQAVRIFCTDEGSFAPQPPPRTPDLLTPDISGFDAALGRTYAELGLEARSMHKCQGTSQLLLLPGQPQARTYRLQESLIDRNNVAPRDLFDGIDTSLEGLARFAGPVAPEPLKALLASLTKDVRAAIQGMTTQGSFGAVQPLIAGLKNVRDVRRRLPALGLPEPARFEIDFRLAQKERQFQDALLAAAAVRLDALADDGVVIPGQAVNISIYATSNAGDTAQLRGAYVTGFDAAPRTCSGSLAQTITCTVAAKIRTNARVSTPYWTPRRDAARYDFEPGVPFGVPFRPSPFRVAFDLAIGGEAVTVDRVVEYRYSHIVAGEKRSELNVSPAFNVTVDPDIAIVPAADLPPKGGNYTHTQGDVSASSPNPVVSAFRRKIINVTIGNNQKGAASATVRLQAPAGWRVEPATAPATFAREDEETTVKFMLSPPAAVAVGELAVKAIVTGTSGGSSDAGYQVVEYPHIHRRHVVQAAAARVKVMDVTIAPGLKVGYIMGVGDKVPDAIEQLGATMTLIDAEALASGDLSSFDAIVLGVRAYERRRDLRANNQRLLQYAENGGTVIVQYQRTEFNEAQYGPFPAKTSADRVTDENAPVEILTPEHPLFNRPNKIGPETWRGWVQERGTYFMGQRDPRYVDLVRSQDPFPYNAAAKTGVLVEARVGKGRWIYTGLGLWRQLPAGTDGAYRLLANLLSLGKNIVKFSPDYVRLVLGENFEDAKAQFLVPIMAIEYAHLVMLADQKIVTREEAASIRKALDGISADEVRKVHYDGTYEDLFFYLDRLIVAGCGADAAGRLHTARSRNDIDMTMYRMSQRQLILSVIEGTLALRRALIPLADRYRDAVFAAHTHTQPAQVSTIAHYLQAVVEQLERDAVRLRAAYTTTNQNPLGACAITGTGFSIDRNRTTALLGFDGTICNTYGSIATVDYLLESVSATAVMLVGLGRVVQDLLLWCTVEFGYLRLADGFVQGSSIMPQKRNPVALEHARAIASKAVGQAAALMIAVHNTPFGDIVDTEDDLQPLVAQMFHDAARAVSLVAAAMAEATFDVEKLAERAGQNWITVTELADTLARDHGLPFKAGHTIAARLIAGSRATPDRSIAELVREISKDVSGREIVYTDAQLAQILSPQHFVEVRKTYGGPSPSETLRAIGVSKQALATDDEWLNAARGRLAAAGSMLRKASAAL